MRQIKAVAQILAYLSLVKVYIGRRFYLVYLVSSLGTLAEGFGLVFIFPFLINIVINNDKSSPIEASGLDFLPKFELLYGLSNIQLVLILIGVYAVKSVLTFSAQAYAASIRSHFLAELKSVTFMNITKIQYKHYATLESGALTNLASEQVTKSIVAYNALIQLGVALFQTIIYLSMAFFATWQLGMVLLCLAIPLSVFFAKINSYVRNLSRVSAAENSVLLHNYLNLLNGFKYVKATGKIDFLVERARKSIKKLAFNEKLTVIWASFTQALQEPIGISVILILVAYHSVLFGIEVEFLIASLALFYRAFQSIFGVQTYAQHLMGNVGSLEAIDKMSIKMQGLLDLTPQTGLPFKNGDIQFRNVHFEHSKSGTPIFENLNLKVNMGDTVALKGDSGSGKTTFLDLLCGLLHPSSGSIEVSGTDIQSIDKHTFASNIGYVTQDSTLLNASILNNLVFSNRIASHEDEIRILSLAEGLGLYHVINNLPKKLDTVVGEKGHLLSGGQIQRLLIIREILKSPQILILDEATSGLDARNDSKVLPYIRNALPDCTIFYVTHKDIDVKNFNAAYKLKNRTLHRISSGSGQ